MSFLKVMSDNPYGSMAVIGGSVFFLGYVFGRISVPPPNDNLNYLLLGRGWKETLQQAIDRRNTPLTHDEMEAATVELINNADLRNIPAGPNKYNTAEDIRNSTLRDIQAEKDRREAAARNLTNQTITSTAASAAAAAATSKATNDRIIAATSAANTAITAQKNSIGYTPNVTVTTPVTTAGSGRTGPSAAAPIAPVMADGRLQLNQTQTTNLLAAFQQKPAPRPPQKKK